MSRHQDGHGLPGSGAKRLVWVGDTNMGITKQMMLKGIALALRHSDIEDWVEEEP